MKKILVIDDDEDIVDVVKHLLVSHGFEVYTHSTSFDIPNVIKLYHPNLILLDILFFGKSGIEICKELKQQLTIPIILFSADVEKGKKFSECSADAFIPKPFDANKFLDTISSHLN
jgi:DNA-binding response OmpR family regulator